MINPRILIAGVGNIFLGDDAFGVEVVRRLAQRPLPEGVRAVDFGIRGLDLTYALLDGHDVVILVDAIPRGGEPGTLYVLEPVVGEEEMAPTMWRHVFNVPLTDGHVKNVPPQLFDLHALHPAAVLRLTRSLGGKVERILLVGCEPTPIAEDDWHMELSAPVEGAVGEAVAVIESLVAQIRSCADAPGSPSKEDSA